MKTWTPTTFARIRHQLAHLFGVAGSQYDLVHYMNDEAACKERLAELGLKPFGAG
jgi:hypothetical protein